MSEENAKLKAIAAIPAQIAALENEKKKMLDELEQSRLKVLAEAQKLRRETSSHAFLSKTKTDYSRLVQDSLRQVNNRFARRQ